MNKVKYTFTVALAVLAVLLGACLPRLISAAGDRRTLGQPGSRGMQAVQFEIHRNIPALGKLSLLSGEYEAIEIPENKAQLSADEAAEAFLAAAIPLIDAGLMADFQPGQTEVHALLVRSETVSGIFWAISVIADRDATYTVDAVVDDETGQLLGIHVRDRVLRGNTLRNEYLYTFAKHYFEGLEITDYAGFQAEVTPDPAAGRDSATYRFTDAVYGEVEVTLYVSEYGFGVELYQTEAAAYEGI